MEKEIIFELPSLETERLFLRKLTIEDLEDIFAYGSDEEVSKYVTWDTHQKIEDSKSFLDFALGRYNDRKVAPWGIEYKENQRLVGTIDFVWWKPGHRTAEIGYVLSRDYWGKGIMTEAAKEIIQYGFEQMGLVRIQAKCFEENVPSARVMEKIGMSFEGIMRKEMFVKGKHQDLKLYSILKEDYIK